MSLLAFSNFSQVYLLSRSWRSSSMFTTFSILQHTQSSNEDFVFAPGWNWAEAEFSGSRRWSSSKVKCSTNMKLQGNSSQISVTLVYFPMRTNRLLFQHCGLHQSNGSRPQKQMEVWQIIGFKKLSDILLILVFDDFHQIFYQGHWLKDRQSFILF